MNDSYSSTLKTITTGVRPASVVTFIDSKDEHWAAYCLRIIEWYSQMWGGGYNLIIPTDVATIEPDFWFILEQFSPDYVYYYTPSLADIQSINPTQWEKIVEERIQYSLGTQEPSDDDVNTVRSQIEEYATEELISDFELTECLGKQLIRKLNPFHSENWLQGREVTLGSEVHYPLVDLVHVLPQIIGQDILFQAYHEMNLSVIDELVIYSSLGFIREAYKKEMEEAGVRIDKQIYLPEQQRDLVDLIFHHTDRIHPFRASMLNLGLYYPVAARREWEDPVILILGDSLKDFCLYFSLSRLRSEVYWMPYFPVSKYTYTPPEWCIDYQRGLLIELGERIREKNAYLVSQSLEEQRILEAKARLVEFNNKFPLSIPELEDRLLIESDVTKLLPYVWRAFEENNNANSYRDQFVNGEGINFINTPLPKSLANLNPEHHRWITELKIEGYDLPALPFLGKLTVQDSYNPDLYSTQDVRVSKHGICYFCPSPFIRTGEDINATLRNFKLHLLEPFELFEEIFKYFGLHIRYSDKGDYQREATAKIGSLEALADICKQEHYRNLFDLYLDEKKSNSGEYGKGVVLKSGRCLTLTAIENVVGELDQDSINVLLEKSVLHRGFVFKCERCRNADWYSISEVTDTFQCRRCDTRQAYLSAQLRLQRSCKRVEPEWFYKLDELFYQGWKNDMYVPILTLAKLQKDAKSSFLYIPEIGYSHDANSIDPEMELDICAVYDGEIVLGECKKSDRLEKTSSKEKEVIREYLAIAEKIGARRLIFSTFQENWADAMMDNVHELLGGSEIHPEFLTKSELLGESE